MNWRRAYRCCFGLVAAHYFALIAIGNASGEPLAKLPNIVLIISDDQGWTDYSFMGHPHVRTPNIDMLASQGRTFTHGYVPSSLCCPSLASLITGLYPHQHLITSNDPPDVASNDRAVQTKAFVDGRDVMNRHMEAVPTLPRMLASAGYISLQTGKWWQGDYHRGGFTQGMTRGMRHGDDGLEIGRTTMQPIHDFLAEAGRDGRPFFLWYAPMMPHTPHNPPQELIAKYLPAAPSPAVAKYWAMIEWFDETVGRLLSQLMEQGFAENTIVVFLADNGWITNPATGDFAAKSKTSPYDGGVRTPIIIRWPGHIKPEVRQELAVSIDIAPTLLRAVGMDPTAEMTGINLLDNRELGLRTSIFGECFTHTALDLERPAANLRWRWMIDGTWKLIVPDPRNQPNDRVELYNIQSDEREEHNVAAIHPAATEQMRRKLDAWWAGD